MEFEHALPSHDILESMMANLQSRVGKSASMNKSWIRPGYEPPKKSSQQSHQDLREENGPKDDVGPQEPYRRSGSPSKRTRALVDRIQMDQEKNGGQAVAGSRDTGQAEKSLIERIEIAPDDTNTRLYRSTTQQWAPSQDGKSHSDWNGQDRVEWRNGRLIQHFCPPFEFGIGHGQKPLSDQQNGAYKQLDLPEGSKDSANVPRSHSYPTPPNPPDTPSRSFPRDDHTTNPNRDISNSDASIQPSHEVTHPPHSVTPEEFIDHFLPLAQQIADIRREDSKDGTFPDSLEKVNSGVFTAEMLAQFSKQLLKLNQDLQDHHREDNAQQTVPAQRTQGVVASNETQIPPGAPVNGRGHHPEVLERTSAPVPSAVWSKEIPIPLHGLLSPTSEYPERKRRPSFASPSSHTSTANRTYHHDPSRRYSSSSFEYRRTSRDLSPHDYRPRSGMRGWDYPDYRDHTYSKSRREDSDRMSASSHKRRAYSPSRHERRKSSPSRYHRRGSPEPLPPRRRPRSPRSRSPERRHHPHERPRNDFISSSRRHNESLSNRVREPYAHPEWSASELLQDVLENRSGVASSQRGPGTLSGLNIPGLWFASRGLQDTGMSTFEFEIDEPTALKWNIQSNSKDHTQTTLEGTEAIDNQARLRLSLELSCFSVDDVRMVMQSLGRDRFRDVVKALSTLKTTWPPKGHLIISINAESQNKKFWFPDTFSRRDPIELEEFVHKGLNFLRFIQLADLSRSIFVLLANGIENDTRLNFLLPDKGGGSSFQKAIPTISKA